MTPYSLVHLANTYAFTSEQTTMRILSRSHCSSPNRELTKSFRREKWAWRTRTALQLLPGDELMICSLFLLSSHRWNIMSSRMLEVTVLR